MAFNMYQDYFLFRSQKQLNEVEQSSDFKNKRDAGIKL